MLCRVVAVKVLLIHHHIAGYIFWSFRIIEFIYSHFENRILFKSVLGGFAGVAHFITGHEQTHLNRVSYFHFFGVLLAFKGSTIQNLFILKYK